MKIVMIYKHITSYPAVPFIDITVHVETNYRIEKTSLYCNQ